MLRSMLLDHDFRKRLLQLIDPLMSKTDVDRKVKEHMANSYGLFLESHFS